MCIRLIATVQETVTPRCPDDLPNPSVDTIEEQQRQERTAGSQYLLIDKTPDGIFLFRFTASGDCFADTWHMSIEDAKHQANYEYPGLIIEWHSVPPDVDDPVAFAAKQLN